MTLIMPQPPPKVNAPIFANVRNSFRNIFKSEFYYGDAGASKADILVVIVFTDFTVAR